MRIILAAACIVLASCGGSGGSPEAVFESAKKAVESKDWKGFYACVDPEKAQEMVVGALFMASFSVMQDKDGQKQVEEIGKRHGCDLSSGPGAAKGDPKEMLKSVKDPAGFFNDLMTFSDAKSKPGEKTHLAISGQLADVKVQGDTATGSMTTKEGKKDTMNFVRRGGSWYLSPGK
ncbi:MAG TPA: hypothetical protein VJB14_17780 [Planctomycetota bacterium]|nr:hypothetical protein [Planctomycetota bacterium]